ncbi:MAG: HPP family protein [Pseudorhodobacter sp.]
MNWKTLRYWRPLGPALANPALREMLRASIGTGFALVACFGAVGTLFPDSGGEAASIFLISPLAATAFLATAVPSSPLAQPWSAVVGNTVSGLIGVALVLAMGDHWIALGLSVTLSMIAMMRLRALHPPAAGVALGTILTAGQVQDMGFAYAFMPVFVDTCLILIFAALYNRMTGRRYPFRQPAEHNPQVEDRLGLRPRLESSALEAILQRLRLDANIGAGDLERLIEAAHLEAASHLFDGVSCRQLMTPDVISLRLDTPLSTASSLFDEHRVRALPVTDADGNYRGLLSETDLLRHWRKITEQSSESSMFGRLLRAGRDAAVPIAAHAMATNVTTVSPDTPLGVLIDIMADGGQMGLPVLEQDRLAGFVTRSDLVAALARAHHPESE